LCSTRVSNELGAGHPRIARLSVIVVLVVALIVGILVGSILILIRNIWGYAFSNEVEVVHYVATMMPILALSNFVDGLQCVLSGYFYLLNLLYNTFRSIFDKTILVEKNWTNRKARF
jgi:Na+-driven multidrug efflux pump